MKTKNGLTYVDFLDWGGDEPRRTQRDGQFWFKLLHLHRPDLADEIRATDLDPFYVDDRLEAFFAYVESHWDD